MSSIDVAQLEQSLVQDGLADFRKRADHFRKQCGIRKQCGGYVLFAVHRETVADRSTDFFAFGWAVAVPAELADIVAVNLETGSVSIKRGVV